MISAARPRALIVEDDSAVRASIAMLLDLMGVDSSLAADGKAAMEQFDRAAFDFAMIDLGLPDTDGGALSDRIREIDPCLPIVIMSADGIPPALHADRSFEKPGRPGQLRAILGEILSLPSGSA